MSRKVEKLLQKAIQAHQVGDLAAAELGYKKVLRAEPRNINGLYLLGTLRYHQQNHGEAEELLETVLRLEPRFAQAHCNLGLVMEATERKDEAQASYRKALQLNPDLAEALNNLGGLLRASGDLDAALHNYRRAVECDGASALYLRNCADTMLQAGDLDGAEDRYQGLLGTGQSKSLGHWGLGQVLYRKEQLEDALEHLEQAVRGDDVPRDALLLLGVTYRRLHRPREAEAILLQAARRKDLEGEARFHIAACRHEQGDIAGSIRELERSLAVNPGSHHARSNYLFYLNYLPLIDEGFLASRHKELAPCETAGRVRKSGDRQRRLKIGYLSPDFRDHSVGYFMLPIIQGHDRGRFKVILISTFADRESPMARVLEKSADLWVDRHDASAEELGKTLDELELDILVELSGYTTENLLATVATRRAPLQVSYLGYPNTTGLGSVDIRIVDRHTDPPGFGDSLFTEQLVRMDKSFLCYSPPPGAPGMDQAARDGPPVFGSFNNLAKLNRRVFDLWADLMQAVPESCLLLKAFGFTIPDNISRVRAEFGRRGVAPGRIEILGPVNAKGAHLEVYRRVDVALDTFPYNGTTTTCEALWMGVPVMVMEGDRHRARVGYSILKNTGLVECIARDEAEFVARASALAERAETASRPGVREALQASPLMDVACFMEDYERILEEAHTERVA